MEAPEKIYFTSIEDGLHYYTEEIPFGREYIEYTRADVFVEKSCQWIKSHGGFTLGFDGATVKDFMEYIKNELCMDITIKQVNRGKM